uniref:Uncharacterized protein n=1 Tax=Catagonus wagneri TaxID=51154 RepID=A0A8C3VTE7_9CETA
SVLSGFGFNSLMAGRSASPGQLSIIFIPANWSLQFLKLIVGRRVNDSRLTYKLIWVSTKVSSIHNLAKSSE